MTDTIDDFAALLRELIAETRASRITYEAHQSTPIAPPSDWTDPTIGKYDPYGWHGESFAGGTFSDATPEYLDEVARAAAHKAIGERAEKKLAGNGKPAYVYSLQRAGRARRWALRKRLGWVAPPKPVKEPSALGGEVSSDGLGSGGFGGGGTGLGSDAWIGGTVAAAESESAEDDFPFGANATADDDEPL